MDPSGTCAGAWATKGRERDYGGSRRPLSASTLLCPAATFSLSLRTFVVCVFVLFHLTGIKTRGVVLGRHFLNNKFCVFISVS